MQSPHQYIALLKKDSAAEDSSITAKLQTAQTFPLLPPQFSLFLASREHIFFGASLVTGVTAPIQIIDRKVICHHSLSWQLAHARTIAPRRLKLSPEGTVCWHLLSLLCTARHFNLVNVHKLRGGKGLIHSLWNRWHRHSKIVFQKR